MKAAVKREMFPLAITRKGVTVRIYEIDGTNGYGSYQIADYSNGNRKLRSYSDLRKAKAEAKTTRFCASLR